MLWAAKALRLNAGKSAVPAPPAGMMTVLFPNASSMKLFTLPAWERDTMTLGALVLYSARGRTLAPSPTKAQAGKRQT